VFNIVELNKMGNEESQWVSEAGKIRELMGYAHCSCRSVVSGQQFSSSIYYHRMAMSTWLVVSYPFTQIHPCLCSTTVQSCVLGQRYFPPTAAVRFIP
jgi:hypothetical protein